MREPLPAEPGRVVVSALLSRPRRARGCVTPGDDRLETRAYAVKRYLFRLGHAARSARYATSVEQLVVGLAPVMGWGKAPRERAERARFVRAHRKSVQRWLDDLQAAGVVAHEPERDQLGRWWRTQILLLAAPDPTVDELHIESAATGTRIAGTFARQPRLNAAAAIYALRRMPRPDPIQRGEFYEDCRYHPMLCVQPSPPDDDELVGISLIDGGLGACSEDHCGVVRMTVEEAIERKVNWNRFAEKHGLPNPHPRDGWKPGEIRG